MYPTLDLTKINFTPYPYQIEAVNKLIEWGMRDDRTKVHTLVSLIQSGKTFCACAAIGELYKQGKKIWIIVNREELVEQWRGSLFELNPDIPRKNLWYIWGNKPEFLKCQIQIVQVQTLARRFEKMKDKEYARPDVIFIDEAHTVARADVIRELTNQWNPKQINITATPVFHGKNKEQYVDRFPVWELPNNKNPLKGTGEMLWHIGADSKMMLDLKRWKNPKWIIGSDELSNKTSRRFREGVTIKGYDYDATSQAAVMIDLIPDHIAEWKLNGGDKRSTIWYCVNQNHCIEMVKALIKEGRKVALVLSKLTIDAQNELTKLGVIFNRKEAIKKYKSGELTDLVNCECLTTGFSASIGSCAVWCRRTMSVGLFCQMSGRVLTYHPDFDEALLMDFAGNLGVHKVFPETIDWLDFNASKVMFRDPNQVVCHNCGYRHDSTPKPKHINKYVKFSVKLGQFVYPEKFEGIREYMQPEHNINCEKCNHPVYFNYDQLSAYSDWLSSVRAAMMCDQKPDKFKGDSAGISIGRITKDCSIKLTIGDMYEVGLWSIVDEDSITVGDGEKVLKDKSIAWEKIRSRQLEALDDKVLRLKKLSKLTIEQREFIESYDVKKLLESTEPNSRYRAALSYMYINDRSPLKSYSYWIGDTDNPPKNIVSECLNNLYGGDFESYEMLKNWLHGHYETQTDYKKKGVIASFIKILSELK